jgi:hypothetical protein
MVCVASKERGTIKSHSGIHRDTALLMLSEDPVLDLRNHCAPLQWLYIASCPRKVALFIDSGL